MVGIRAPAKKERARRARGQEGRRFGVGDNTFLLGDGASGIAETGRWRATLRGAGAQSTTGSLAANRS
jgi:hypothetical protein